jgi:hypothetical protein
VEGQSRDEKKHIDTKDVVGLLLVEVVSTKKKVAKDVVGLHLGEVVCTKKNTSSQRMW